MEVLYLLSYSGAKNTASAIIMHPRCYFKCFYACIKNCFYSLFSSLDPVVNAVSMCIHRHDERHFVEGDESDGLGTKVGKSDILDCGDM